MSWIEVKYAGMLQHKLEKFKIKKRQPFMANCRCPYCGDSDVNKSKARGYIISKGDKVYYFCHNCGTSQPFWKLLKDLDSMLYNEYRLETMAETAGCVKKASKKQDELVEEPSKTDVERKLLKRREGIGMLHKLSALPSDHYAKKYVEGRLIPQHQHYRLFFTDKFVEFSQTFAPDKMKGVKEHSRLIIPFFDRGGKFVGFTGRSFEENDKKRYIIIMFEENANKAYGLDKVDFDKDILVVEGPLDSLFLPNCIAMAGSDLSIDGLNKEKTTFVFDNEPRNKDIVRLMQKRIDQGYNICIWSETMKEKDINDMVLAGYAIEEISGIVFRNSFAGVEANLRLNEWRRV